MSEWDPRDPRDPRGGPPPRRPPGPPRGGGPSRGGAAAPRRGGGNQPPRRRAARPAPPPSEAPTEQIPVVGRQPAARRTGRSDRKRGRRRNARVLIVVGIIFLPFLLALGWFAYQLRPGSDGPAVLITVRDGMGTSEIADELVEKDVIGSALAFKLWTTMSGGGPYQTGCHDLHEGLGIRGAVSELEKTGGTKVDGKCIYPSDNPDLDLFLPPARRLDQVAQILGELEGHTPEEFTAVFQANSIRSKYMPPEVTSLEGFLFPDTYKIGADWTAEQIVQRLVNRFDEIADAAGLANVQGLTPYQAVVAASLIQTEAKIADDAPQISAVIRNRLAQGMQLQIDSTLCYARYATTGTGCPPVPTDADKQINSPYNTYLVAALPPTPISGVTEASLRAAINPANVPYLFYVVSDAEGHHAFATTLEEHNRNVAAAREKGLL